MPPHGLERARREAAAEYERRKSQEAALDQVSRLEAELDKLGARVIEVEFPENFERRPLRDAITLRPLLEAQGFRDRLNAQHERLASEGGPAAKRRLQALAKTASGMVWALGSDKEFSLYVLKGLPSVAAFDKARDQEIHRRRVEAIRREIMMRRQQKP